MAKRRTSKGLDPMWVSGFLDGEGLFHVAINRIADSSLGWQVLPDFRVVRQRRDRYVLMEIRKALGCGKIYRHHKQRIELRVRGNDELKKVLRFFREYPLQTAKKDKFDRFCRVLAMMDRGDHLKKSGLRRIAEVWGKKVRNEWKDGKVKRAGRKKRGRRKKR